MSNDVRGSIAANGGLARAVIPQYCS